MAKFLFWNLNQRAIPGFVRTVAREHDVDVLILAECRISTAELLEALNESSSDYQYAWGNCNHLVFFTRFDAKRMKPLLESNRVSIRRLQMQKGESLLIAGAHLPSKVNYSDYSQIFESVNLARMINEVEAQEGHQRTVVLGDLNMNPFEIGMIGARGGLHAVMSRRVAARESRIVQKEKCTFFYNPMWNHLGDSGKAGGTFYFENGEPVCYFWNMFDQVLLRPDLLTGFEPEQVRIVTEVGRVSLLEDDGRPDKTLASDHLPVLLELKF